jgi:cation transport ATPase
MVQQAGAAVSSLEMSLGVLLHTAAMLLVMALIAWIVYRRVGLAVLRRRWVNFDLIWAVALLVAGGIALLSSAGIL